MTIDRHSYQQNMAKLFVCSESGQKDWWRPYRVEIAGHGEFSLRSGEGRWLELESGNHAIKVTTKFTEEQREVQIDDSTPWALSVSGGAKYVLSKPGPITISDVTDDLAKVPLLDWRAAGYTPIRMMMGYAMLIGIFIVLIGIILVSIAAKGTGALFMLVWLPIPMLVLDMILRSSVGLFRSSRTRKMLSSTDDQPTHLPKPTTPRLMLSLLIMATCIGVNWKLDHMGLPAYVSVLVLVASLAVIVLIGRSLRAQQRSA